MPCPSPGAGEVLIRVEAATTCGTDLKVYLAGGHPRMLEPPCPFGHEVSGVVVETGEGSDRWRVGDCLVVANSASCGTCPECRDGRENLCRDLQYLNGAYADHLVVPARFVERSSLRRPADLDPAIAAMAEPLACVLHGVAACGELPEQVLVLGGGPIGLMFVAELARLGRRVVLADPVKSRLEVGSVLGATATVRVEAAPGDAARLRDAVSGGRGAPLVIEATGSPLAWSVALDTVASGGTVVLFGGCAPGTEVALDTHRVHYSELTIKGVYHHRPATFVAALDRLATGDLDLRPLLQAEYGLEGVEQALCEMQSRRVLKAVIRP
jgi:L-iditol 2-dehydrogenase